MPTGEELIGCGRDDDGIREAIGADWLVYQDLDDLVEAVSEGNPDIKQFDTSVFTGTYVTGDVGEDYLRGLQASRNDESKTKRREQDEEVIDLHNTA
jgi:amidophosphoribosyltransferase